MIYHTVILHIAVLRIADDIGIFILQSCFVSGETSKRV